MSLCDETSDEHRTAESRLSLRPRGVGKIRRIVSTAMYQLDASTITKRIESWKLILPLHDNNGVDFDEGLIDSITEEIVANFPGMTAINCVGYWRSSKQTYKDRSLELIIDVAPTDSNSAEKFFAKYKTDLAERLHQEKIYLTRDQSKTEVISYDEFLPKWDSRYRQEPRQQICDGLHSAIENVNFIIARMSYETTLLRRDTARGLIIWERRICGIQLRSELPDDCSPDTDIIAADRIDQFAEWLGRPRALLVVGDWEFQKFALSKRPFTPLVEAEVPAGIDFKIRQYLSQSGEPISH